MRGDSRALEQRLFKTPVLEHPRAIGQDLYPRADFPDLGRDFEEMHVVAGEEGGDCYAYACEAGADDDDLPHK